MFCTNYYFIIFTGSGGISRQCLSFLAIVFQLKREKYRGPVHKLFSREGFQREAECGTRYALLSKQLSLCISQANGRNVEDTEDTVKTRGETRHLVAMVTPGMSMASKLKHDDLKTSTNVITHHLPFSNPPPNKQGCCFISATACH